MLPNQRLLYAACRLPPVPSNDSQNSLPRTQTTRSCCQTSSALCSALLPLCFMLGGCSQKGELMEREKAALWSQDHTPFCYLATPPDGAVLHIDAPGPESSFPCNCGKPPIAQITLFNSLSVLSDKEVWPIFLSSQKFLCAMSKYYI